MLLGQKLGLDPAVLASVINSSTGGCWASSVNNPVPGALPEKSPPCERDYQGGFITALMLKVRPSVCHVIDGSRSHCVFLLKDMGLATEIAKKNLSPLPLGELAEALYAKAIQEQPELATQDFSSVYKFLKSRAMGTSQ